MPITAPERWRRRWSTGGSGGPASRCPSLVSAATTSESRIDTAESARVVDAALEAGINFFDTADIYSDGRAEAALGTALGGRRNEVIVGTKFGGGADAAPNRRGGSRLYVVRAAERSLRELGTDYIDLFQMHFPDPATPIEETLSALDDLVRAGKVRYAGSSNFAGWQIADTDWTARQAGLVRMVSAQNRYSLLERRVEEDVLPACRRFGVGQVPWLALAGGVLTGKYRRDRAAPAGRGCPPTPALATRLPASRTRRGCCPMPTSMFSSRSSASPRRSA